jgi:hypothetical protein
MKKMPLGKSRRLLALSISALLLSACGGGSTPSAATKTATGVVVDGYIQGATVFLDINRNGVLDATEPSTTTDMNGRYTLNLSAVTVPTSGLPVVVTGGVDADTGFAFTGKLSAPVESTLQAQVVTPLSTLVDAMVAQGLVDDVTTAKQRVAAALGLTVDALSTDPVVAIANQPGIYTTVVALQRAIQLLANANVVNGEALHESQERVVRALALAIRSQVSPVDVSQLVANVALSNASAAQQLARAVTNSVRTGLQTSGHEGAKVALRAWDEVGTRMRSDGEYNLTNAADKLDAEHGYGTTRLYYHLTQDSSSASVLEGFRNLGGSSNITLVQPVNTTGRLLASNCFQCHGTGGVGGFERIRGGEADEIREYLTRPANSSIMAAHAQGYTAAQLNAIIAYLQQ